MDHTSPEAGHAGARARWAQALSGDREALGALSGSFWYPVYAWWGRTGHAHPGAATEGCFTRWLSTEPPHPEQPGAARWREWLRARLAEDDGAPAAAPVLEIADAWAEARFAEEPEGPPDTIFQRRWALTMLEFTMDALRDEYAARGEEKLFEEVAPLAGFSGGEEERYQAIAGRIGTSTGAAHRAVFEFRHRHRERLRVLVADTLADPDDLENELTTLLCACELPAAEAPLPPALRAAKPEELLARALGSVRMTTGATGLWSPPTAAEMERLFPQYEMLGLLGRGGMGAVYKARQRSLDRCVAIKLLPLEVSVDQDFADRFVREARAMAKLSHPNIIAVHDFGTTAEGHLFFTMQFIEGSNLHDLIHGKGLRPEQALEILDQVCAALAYAHGKGVIHRDIKPPNVMVDTDGQVKVADFGLARLTGAGTEAYGHTMTGTVMGTPDYMAPEQWRGMNVDHRADIYALGVMLYEMLCREVPKGIFEPPSHRTGCDSAIDRIVTQAMQQAPERRFQSTRDMRTEIAAAMLAPVAEFRAPGGSGKPPGGLPPPLADTIRTVTATPISQMPPVPAAAAAPGPARSTGTLVERPHLPVSATRYFGREKELRELQEALQPVGSPAAGGRLLTLLGSGGTGKTRLALEVAEALQPAYRSAVWFVPLADLRSSQALAETIRNALRLAPEPSFSALEQITHYLGKQPALLVLDNFEQIDPGGALFVRSLLAELPQLTCLVTSRRLLGLSGEAEYALLPLATPSEEEGLEVIAGMPSVQLFCDRARLARPAFALTEGNARDVAKICTVLEGMPLALELAAARINVVTPSQMLTRLNSRLEFLVGRRTDVAERHRTLRAALAWSYDLLPAGLRAVFAQLAVFRGGWSLEAAEEVVLAPTATEPLPVLDALDELRNCSLVLAEEADGEMRYRMLELVHEFAGGQLPEAEQAAVAGRHHAFFCQVALNAVGLPATAHLSRLGREHENLRALLRGAGPLAERARAAVALYHFWMVRGFHEEGRDALLKLADPALELRDRSRLWQAAGILSWSANRFTEAENLLRQTLPAWETLGDEKNTAAVYNNLGLIAFSSGDRPKAREYYQQGLVTFRRLGLASQTAAVLSNLGELGLAEGDLPFARECLEESLALQRELDEPADLANTLHHYAELWHAEGEPRPARAAMAECIGLRRALGDFAFTPWAFITLSRIALAEGREPLAHRCLAAAEHATRKGPERDSRSLRKELSADWARLSEANPLLTPATPAGSLLPLDSVLEADGRWSETLDALPVNG